MLGAAQPQVNAENRVAVAASKGIEVVVRPMEAHGCLALTNIARSDSGLQSQVRSAGAVPLRMEALSAFPDHGVLQREEGVLLAKLGP